MDDASLLAQAGKRKTRSAAGLVNKCGVFYGIKNIRHAVLYRQHKAGGKLTERATGIHKSRRVWHKLSFCHHIIKAFLKLCYILFADSVCGVRFRNCGSYPMKKFFDCFNDIAVFVLCKISAFKDGFCICGKHLFPLFAI